MAKKKIKIDQNVCIGCGTCAACYAEDIKIGDNGLAEPINGQADEEAATVCPVGAISVEE